MNRVPATERKAKARARRALLLASVSLAAILVVAPGQSSRAAQAPFDGLEPMSRSELGEQRGGFSWGQVSFNFGFSITTVVQNALQPGQAFHVVTTFTMSHPGGIEDLQTSVTLSDDQTPDTAGVGGSDNVTVNTVSWFDFDFDLDFDDGDGGSWNNVNVYGPGEGPTAPTPPTPPQITPPTPPTVTAPTPPTVTVPTSPNVTELADVTPTVNGDVVPNIPVVVPPPATTDVPPPVTTNVTPPVTTPPVTTPPVTTNVTPPVTTPPVTTTPVTTTPVTTPPAPVTTAAAPPPVPVAVVTTPLSGGGHQVSVGDAIATQIIHSVSTNGISSASLNRLPDRLLQENFSMNILVGGAHNLSQHSKAVRNAVRIGRASSLSSLRD